MKHGARPDLPSILVHTIEHQPDRKRPEQAAHILIPRNDAEGEKARNNFSLRF
ncbi:MAG TPA: hypothetical protein PLV96_07335 [Methanoregulaceae archaeon]|nr:hypothetical protein [Methanoregulaceae archaeon]HPX73940.1 hypothetical protein [Methanoregulaceae archaeon]HQA80594.1 hypothetical protein [Methanoregulaceae archaeon]